MKFDAWFHDYNVVCLRYAFFALLRAEGLSNSEIAHLFSASRHGVGKRLRGGPPTHHDYTPHPAFEHSVGTGRERARALVRHRDDYTCWDCGFRRTPREVREHNQQMPTLQGRIKNLDVHHINGKCGTNSRGYDPTEDLTDLITVCHKCHYNRHDHRQFGAYRTQPARQVATL